MCLINFHFGEHPHYRLIMAANRDELYSRPTAPAHFWPDQPDLLAGRDLLQKGTWLGIAKQGRYAALTNYRNPTAGDHNKTSRGELIKNYLTRDIQPFDYLTAVHDKKDHYAGFNLLVGTTDVLYYYNNMEGVIYEVPQGTHGLSNRFLNTPWPKVTKGKQRLKTYVKQHEEIETDPLFDLLLDTEQAWDDQLPETGIGLDLERQLSPLFIQTPSYGTKSSTVLLIGKHNNVTFIERTYEKGIYTAEKAFNFTIKNQ